MEFFVRLGWLLALLLVGVGLRAVGVLTERRRTLLTAVAFYVALPALIFSSTHDQSLDTLLSPALVGGFWLVVGAVALAGYLVHRHLDARETRSVAIVQSYHSNLGFLGLPLVAASLGDFAAAKASVILGAGVLFHVPLTIVVLTTINDANADVGDELRTLLENPVIWSLVVGLAVAAVAWRPPAAATRTLGAVSELALPLALLAVGASLDLTVPETRAVTTGAVVALKVVAMPLTALAVFSALSVAPVTRAAAVVMAGTPTAVSTYVYAAELGGDEGFASLNVFATTVVSVATLFGLLWLVG
ncbi:MAG: AEC family transporter [Halobacteriaceae archaeon]